MPTKTSTRLVTVLVLAVICFASCASLPKAEADDTKPVAGVETVSVDPEVAGAPEEETDRTADEGNWLSALGTMDGLSVASYRIRGEGPDGSSFDWITVTSPKVALSDVKRGQWTIYGEAISANGDVVATGKLETFLSSSTPLGAVYLDPTSGYGSARCAFSWAYDQVLSPSLSIYVRHGDGEWQPRDNSEISIGDNSAVWKATGLPAGPYTVRAILNDGDETVSGIAAAMRIIDGRNSVGNMRFVIGRLSTVYGIALENAPANTISGRLEIEDGVAEYVSEDDIRFHDWFVDGAAVDETGADLDLFALSLHKGYHRIDIVVQGHDPNSINSDSVLVYVDPVLVKQVDAEYAETHRDDVPEGYGEPVSASDEIVEVSHQQTDETPSADEASGTIPVPADEPVVTDTEPQPANAMGILLSALNNAVAEETQEN